MDYKTLGKTAFCAVCGKQFIKPSNNAKYCSMPCKRKVEKDQNREWLREYYRRLREERRIAQSVWKPRETIEEVVAKANAAGLSYGKYVALQREKEGCEADGRCEVDQDNH